MIWGASCIKRYATCHRGRELGSVFQRVHGGGKHSVLGSSCIMGLESHAAFNSTVVLHQGVHKQGGGMVWESSCIKGLALHVKHRMWCLPGASEGCRTSGHKTRGLYSTCCV